MTGFRKLEQLGRFLGGAATIVTLTLAVTLRVEHSCSGDAPPNLKQIPAVVYPYLELMARSDVYSADRSPRLARFTYSLIPERSRPQLAIHDIHIPRLTWHDVLRSRWNRERRN
jgi:hypothetical protein